MLHWRAPGPFLKPPSEAPPEDESAFIPLKTDPGDQRAILVIPDSRGRIRTWHYLRSLPYWRHFVALCSKSTPQDYLDYLKERHIDCIIAGEDHVDLRIALEELYSRYAVKAAGGWRRHRTAAPPPGVGERGERAHHPSLSEERRQAASFALQTCRQRCRLRLMPI